MRIDVKRFVTGVVAATVMAAGLITFAPLPGTVSADSKNDILNSVNSTADPSSPTVDRAVSAAINVFGFLVGFAAVIMMMVGGYKYITSAGDANKAAQAKSTIMYALIGVALVVVSQVLLRFVIAKTNSTGVTPDAVVGADH